MCCHRLSFVLYTSQERSTLCPSQPPKMKMLSFNDTAAANCLPSFVGWTKVQTSKNKVNDRYKWSWCQRSCTGVHGKKFVNRWEADSNKCTSIHNPVYKLTQVTCSKRQVMLESYVFVAWEDDFTNFQTSSIRYFLLYHFDQPQTIFK